MVAGGAGVAIAGLCLWGNFQAKGAANRGNLCLRQQLVMLQRRHPRPRLSDADRRFWILASRWFSDWRSPRPSTGPSIARRTGRAIANPTFVPTRDSGQDNFNQRLQPYPFYSVARG